MSISRLKRVSVKDLEIGKKYYTVCGIWRGQTVYVGSIQVGKRTKYRFTYGNLENWENQFGHLALNSEIKVYELCRKKVALLDNGDITSSNE